MMHAVAHSNWASATTVATRVVLAVGWAWSTGVTVPDGSFRRTVLTVFGLGIFPWHFLGAAALIGVFIPDMGSWASDTFSGIRVEVRMLGVTQTFGKSCIESESRRTTFTSLGVFVPMSIRRTRATCLRGFIPVKGFLAIYTDVLTG